MKSPYTILGVSEKSDDHNIKQAYLEAVRNNPPDREPVKFREIRIAYESIATHKDRLRYELFDTSKPDSIEIAELVLQQGRSNKNISEKAFRSILDQVVNEKISNIDLLTQE
ncbi:MAG: DnaJ domain-containing protein [Thermodesulfobacteriota bacterium]|nr:DnaJ domain-containing protein [Thermodesulfobacteriota bacterium]